MTKKRDYFAISRARIHAPENTFIRRAPAGTSCRPGPPAGPPRTPPGPKRTDSGKFPISRKLEKSETLEISNYLHFLFLDEV